MSGLLDLPTAWENPKAFQQVIPAEDRNFERPREPFWPQNMPRDTDFNLADEDNDISFNPQPEPSKEPKLDLEPSDLIKAYQNFFSKANPIIGQLYSGPKDGQPNPELISAAKKTEAAIANKIKNNAVNGMIWSDAANNFNTDPNEVKSVLDLLMKNK